MFIYATLSAILGVHLFILVNFIMLSTTNKSVALFRVALVLFIYDSFFIFRIKFYVLLLVVV